MCFEFYWPGEISVSKGVQGRAGAGQLMVQGFLLFKPEMKP